MKGYTKHQARPKPILNPEDAGTPVSKLHTLLEEYDQENDYLNKQFISLLKKNQQLERRTFESKI